MECDIISVENRIFYIYHLRYNLCWFREKCATRFKKKEKRKEIRWCFALRNHVVFLWIVFNFDDTKDAADEINRKKNNDEHTIYISMTSLQIYKIHGISWRFFFVCSDGNCEKKIQPNEISEFNWIEQSSYFYIKTIIDISAKALSSCRERWKSQPSRNCFEVFACTPFLC